MWFKSVVVKIEFSHGFISCHFCHLQKLASKYIVLKLRATTLACFALKSCSKARSELSCEATKKLSQHWTVPKIRSWLVLKCQPFSYYYYHYQSELVHYTRVHTKHIMVPNPFCSHVWIFLSYYKLLLLLLCPFILMLGTFTQSSESSYMY